MLQSSSGDSTRTPSTSLRRRYTTPCFDAARALRVIDLSRAASPSRLVENLYFANANQVEDRFLAIAERHNDARHLVVRSAINFIDTTGLEMLRRLNHTLASLGIALHLSDVKGPVRDQLESTSLSDELSGNLYPTTDEAMRELGASQATAVEENR